jgi:hypothetical protein
MKLSIMSYGRLALMGKTTALRWGLVQFHTPHNGRVALWLEGQDMHIWYLYPSTLINSGRLTFHCLFYFCCISCRVWFVSGTVRTHQPACAQRGKCFDSLRSLNFSFFILHSAIMNRNAMFDANENSPTKLLPVSVMFVRKRLPHLLPTESPRI